VSAEFDENELVRKCRNGWFPQVPFFILQSDVTSKIAKKRI